MLFVDESTGYRGRPSRALLDRTEAVHEDIAAATKGFEILLQRDLAEINAGLTKGGLQPLTPLERAAWEARSAGK